MFELTLFRPADTAPPESFRDNAILWCAEEKPLPPATLSDDNVQEVVIRPGTQDELRLVFDAFESELAGRVSGVCNSLYVTSGTTGVNDLRNAIVETGWRSFGDMPLPAPPSATPEVRGERVYESAAETPRRHALKVEVDGWLEQLTAHSVAVIQRVNTAALQFANAKLDRSRQLTLQQSLRYFKSQGPSGSTASLQLVRDDSSFAGSDVADLAEAIAQIAAMRREVEFFNQASDAAKAAVRKVGLVDSRTGLFGPALMDASIKQDLRSMLDVPNASGALAKATQGFDAAARVLAQECAEKCKIHPVLLHLWDQPLVFAIADLWNNTPAAQRLVALMADGRLAAAVASVINDTDSAADSFIADLRTNPDEIWKYQRAVEGGLLALHLNQGDLAWRATEEYLEQQRSVMSLLSGVNLSLGVVEMIAALSAVAPPVSVALAVLSAGAGVAELIEGAVNEAQKDRAFQACLDPADSLALEGGSYTGVVISALFIVLQLRGIQSSATRAARLP